MTQFAVEEAAFVALENQEADAALERKRIEAEKLKAELEDVERAGRLHAMIGRALGRSG